MKSVTDQCPDITHVYTIGRSYTGLKLYVMVISDNPSKHELGMELLPRGLRFILEQIQPLQHLARAHSFGPQGLSGVNTHTLSPSLSLQNTIFHVNLSSGQAKSHFLFD